MSFNFYLSSIYAPVVVLMVSSTNTIVIVTPGLKQCYVSTAGGGGGTKEDLSGFPFFIWHSGLKMEKIVK